MSSYNTMLTGEGLLATPPSVPLSEWWWGRVTGFAPSQWPESFSREQKGAVMFDLTKINEVLNRGNDRVRRILGKENTKKVEANGWQAYQQKASDESKRDRKVKLHSPDRKP